MKYNESIESDLLSLPYLIEHYFAYENTNMYPRLKKHLTRQR